jgi:uncharacterized damage-inducible protein DinB
VDPELQQTFNRIESKTEELLGKVERLTAEEQARRPKPSAWSPIEIAHHCRITEGLFGTWMADTKAEVVGRPPTRHPMFRVILWTMNKAVPAPPLKEMEPLNPPPLADIRSHWRSQRSALATALDGKPADRAIVQHKFLGPMSPRQMLDLFDAHLTYHLKRFPS